MVGVGEGLGAIVIVGETESIWLVVTVGVGSGLGLLVAMLTIIVVTAAMPTIPEMIAFTGAGGLPDGGVALI